MTIRGSGNQAPLDSAELADDKLAELLVERADREGVELVGPEGLLTQLTKTVLEKAMNVELADHLGYERGDPAGRGSGNSRNGSYEKRGCQRCCVSAGFHRGFPSSLLGK